MGRPKLPKRKISISVTLEETTKKYVKKLGEGNMSKGIEMAIKERQDLERRLKECEAKVAEMV